MTRTLEILEQSVARIGDEEPDEFAAWIKSMKTPDAQRFHGRSGKTWELVPDATFGIEDPEGLARAMLEAEADYAVYLEMTDAEFAAELRRRLADPVIRLTIANPAAIEAHAVRLETAAREEQESRTRLHGTAPVTPGHRGQSGSQT
jgi:hypothetical protein